ncbi:hypothetical protein OY671_009817, partial [Metschnikowia pulcherrima]
TVSVIVGSSVAAWTVAAGWAVLVARARARKAEAHHRSARRSTRMVDESPASPSSVRADGRIEGPSRSAGWSGLDAMPGYLSELDAGDASDRGLNEVQLSQSSDAVRRAQKTGAAFRMVSTPRGGTRCSAVRGHSADPQVSPGGSALVWFFDFSDS